MNLTSTGGRGAMTMERRCAQKGGTTIRCGYHKQWFLVNILLTGCSCECAQLRVYACVCVHV